MSDREQRLQEYLDRRLDAAHSAAFEQETLASREMSEELMDELALRELLARRGRRRRSPVRRMAAAAVGVAAVVALVLLWPRGEVPEPVLRSDDATTIELLEPAGELSAQPSTFRWTAVDGAATYRIELFDEVGARQLEQTVTGTSFRPDSSVAIPVRGYWRVTAFDDVGLQIGRSGTARLELDAIRD